MRRFCAVTLLVLLTACSGKSVSSPPATSEAYDAVSALGIGDQSTAPLPSANAGEVIVRYGGWSLNQLLQTPSGTRYLQYLENSYKDESWTNKTLPSGIYRLDDKRPIPVVLLATALLADQLRNGEPNFNARKMIHSFKWSMSQAVKIRRKIPS